MKAAHRLGVVACGLGILAAAPGELSAQAQKAEPKKKVVTATTKEKTDGSEVPEPVVIDHDPLRLTDPAKYQVPLQLAPVRDVELTALTDGIVSRVHVEPGQKVQQQAEVIRLENQEDQLELDRARAHYKVAQIERQRANTDEAELADARLEAAKAELDLATYRFERNSIRAPFAGQVFRIYVVPGQFVRAGQPLLRFGDTTQLTVEVPVDRHQHAAGKPIELRIEETVAPATVQKILPLAKEFEPLRELVHSAASAVVHIDNAGERFQVGQAVVPPAIPLDPVAEVPTAALANLPDGGRRVQVIRENVIRDVPVQLHRQVGTDRIFVSGKFDEADEIIKSSSHELPDGTQVLRLSGAAAPPDQAARAAHGPLRRRPDF